MSRGGEQRCNEAAGKPREQEEKEDDFYDCQETLEPPDPREEEEEKQGDKREEEETRQDGGRSEYCDAKNETITNTETETRGGGGHQEEQGDRLQEDSDSEMKEEKSPEVEFDDDYLREVEKELTDEEKEVIPVKRHSGDRSAAVNQSSLTHLSSVSESTAAEFNSEGKRKQSV